jgi:alpha-L-fucosidase
VIKATLMADNTELKVHKKDGNLMIELPAEAPDKIASVITVTVKGNVKNQYKKSEDKKIDSGALDTKH